MELINKILENDVIFYSIIAVLVITFAIILYFAFFRSEKEDEEVLIENDDIKDSKEKKEQAKQEEIEKTEIELQKELEQQQAKDELQKVIEQMSEDVQNKKEENIEEFETDQEENAIISYQELVNNVRSEKISLNLEDIYEDEALQEIENKKIVVEEYEEPKVNETIPTQVNESSFNKTFEFEEDNKEEIIELDDEDTYSTNFSALLGSDEIDEEKIMDEIKEVPKEETKKYKKSEIISPIYGRQNIDISYPKIEAFDRNKEFRDSLIEIERNLKYEPLTDEEQSNEEFLNTLKEFRRNL